MDLWARNGRAAGGRAPESALECASARVPDARPSEASPALSGALTLSCVAWPPPGFSSPLCGVAVCCKAFVVISLMSN